MTPAVVDPRGSVPAHSLERMRRMRAAANAALYANPSKPQPKPACWLDGLVAALQGVK